MDVGNVVLILLMFIISILVVHSTDMISLGRVYAITQMLVDVVQQLVDGSAIERGTEECLAVFVRIWHEGV